LSVADLEFLMKLGFACLPFGRRCSDRGVGCSLREEFTGLPLADALRRLAGYNGLVMLYRRDKDGGQSRLDEVRVYREPQDIQQAEKTKSKASANAPLHVVQLLPPGESEWPSSKVLGSVPATAAKMPVFRVPKASRIPQERSR
jgi:hypothetical protein